MTTPSETHDPARSVATSISMEKEEQPSDLNSGVDVPKPEEDGAAPEAEVKAPESADEVEEFKPTWRFYMTFITLSMVTLIAALDATSLSVALPIMTDLLHGTAIEAFWAGTSFLLTSTVFQPAFASMSHIFGRKIALYVSLIFFGVGAILAGVANNFTLLLVGRSLQGVGGGGLIAIAEIIVTDLVPLRERGKWFGFLSSMWAVGSVAGPIVGGAFAENVTWRWIFYINLPIVGVALVFVTIFLVLNLVTGTIREKLARFDWIGAIIFIGSVTSFLIPVTWGGVSFPWDSWHTLVPLIIGAVGMSVFCVYEVFLAKEPMVPLTIFENWTLRVTYLETVIHGMILWSMLYYLPLYYEAVKGFSPILSGVALFPETFTVAPASIVVGVVVSIIGKFRWAIWSGWCLTVAGTGLLWLMTPTISTVGWIFVNLVVGLGTGILFPSMAFAIQSAINVRDIAFGVAFYSFFRAFGQGLGVAVGGTVFQNQIKTKILSYPLLAPLADQYSTDATALVSIINNMEDGDMKTQLIAAYADALRILWVVMCALSAVGLFVSLFTKQYSLDQVLQTEQGFKQAKKEGDVEGQTEPVVAA